MKKVLKGALESLGKLFRFIFWYAIGVAGLFYLLPLAGVVLQDHYDAMTSSAKFISILGFFCVIGVWQVMGMKERMSASSAMQAMNG